jgi:two-component system, NarL family, nitrate/nitrite response regulator NarL
MARARRVLLVGDDPLALGGLARLLADESPEWLPLQSPEALDDFSERDGAPDAALVDAGAGGDPDADPEASIDTVAELSRRYPVLVLARDGTRVRDLLAAGARGVVSRGAMAGRIVRALDAVVEGLVTLDEELAEEALRPPTRALGNEEELTPREREVLEHLALGLSNREIAARLGISFHTAKFHVNSILGKLGAASRAEVVAIAARTGLITF